MSKSLKNFITIKEALASYSARQLRLCFLLHQWDSKLDFKDSSLAEAKSTETTLNNFFVNTKALLNEYKLTEFASDGEHQYNEKEKAIINVLCEKQSNVHAALCDSINTPAAMSEILDLINKTNIYLSSTSGPINAKVLEKIASYVTKILRIFGVAEIAGERDIGFGMSENQLFTNTEDIAMPYLRVLSTFRDNVREMARQKQDHSKFLALSDKLRDMDLVNLGVSLDDREDGKALIKLMDKEELIKAREAKLQAQAEKELRKKEAAEAREKEKTARLEKGKIPAEDMFKDAKNEDGELLYSKFDEQGIPTHDAKGTELVKTRVKKLKKEWEARKKLHAEYLTWQQTQE